MALKLLILLGLAVFAAAAPRTRNNLARKNVAPDNLREYLFRRGCSREELNEFEKYGVDVTASNLDCSNASGTQKRSCSFVYSASSACCSPGCNWLMEFHCMSPSQMLCKKK